MEAVRSVAGDDVKGGTENSFNQRQGNKIQELKGKQSLVVFALVRLTGNWLQKKRNIHKFKCATLKT